MTLGRLFFIAALSFFTIGAVILLSADLNKERRADPEYRAEKMDLNLEQYFGKEAVSAGIRKINEEQYNQKKISYWFYGYSHVTFHKEYKEISKDGDVISNDKLVSHKLPAPPKRWYAPESMILKNGELEVRFKKVMISSLGILMLSFAAMCAFAGIVFSVVKRNEDHPTIKIRYK